MSAYDNDQPCFGYIFDHVADIVFVDLDGGRGVVRRDYKLQ
jgi:hypothetical protein